MNSSGHSPFAATGGGGALTNSMLPSAVSNTHKYMNANQVTSVSNNAFIANNFLMPVAVANRHSNLANTRTSRSPVSPIPRNNNTSGVGDK